MLKEKTRLILCQYKEDINWLKNIDIPYTIYNKSKKLSADFENNTISISNIGKEEYAYFSFILDHYDCLPDRVIFSQADPFDHSPDFLELIQNTELFSDVQPLSFFNNKYVPGLQFTLLSKPIFINNNRIHFDFFDEKLRRYYYPAKKFFFAPGGSAYSQPVVNMHRTFFKFLKTRSKLRTEMHNLINIKTRKILGLDITPMCYAAIFSVTKDRILMYPKSYYENILKLNKIMQEEDTRSFGWIMEYMWLELFRYDPPETILEKLNV